MTMSKARILIVDDDPDLLRLLPFRLEGADYAVESADSAERALARFSVAIPQLVITDLRMSGMDGMALFENIHKSNPTLPVIILTAHGSIPDAVAATRRGVFGYLTKPFEAEALLAEIASALRASAGANDPGAASTESWRESIITRSPAIEAVLREAKLVAETDASVFVLGPSGSGKELLARAIHTASPRRSRPFIAVNCGAIPEQLLESELFGHVK